MEPFALLVLFSPIFCSLGRQLKRTPNHRGTNIRVFWVCFRAPFLPPFFPHFPPLVPLQALFTLPPLLPSSPPPLSPPFLTPRKLRFRYPSDLGTLSVSCWPIVAQNRESRTTRFPELQAWNRKKLRSEKRRNESNRSEVESRKIDSESLSESYLLKTRRGGEHRRGEGSDTFLERK